MAQMSPTDVRQVVQDLHLHQLELEAQNQQLRQSEQALVQARNRYAALYDFAPVALLTLSKRGQILAANRTAGQWLGLARARLLRQKFTRFIPAVAQDAFYQLTRQIFNAAVPAGVELALINHAGRPVTVQLEVGLCPEFPARQFRISFTDITERKRAKVALQESEQKFRNLFVSSVDALLTAEPTTGRFTSGNPAAWKLFGARSDAEFVLYGPKELSPKRQPDGRASAEKAREMIATAMRDGSHFFEWTHQRINGEEFFANVLLTRVEQAGKSIIMATVRDISERKSAENALRTLSCAVEQCPASVVITSITGEIHYVNQKFTEITGYTAAEVLGKNPRLLNSGLQPTQLYRELWATILAGRDWRGELCNRRKNGDLFWESVAITPILDPQGTITHFVGLKEDITARKRFESALVKSNDKLAHAQHLARLGGYEINLSGTGGDHWTEEVYRILGLDPTKTELTSSAYVSHCIHPDDQARVRRTFEQSRRERARFDLEYRIVRPDGTVRNVHCIVEPLPGADPQGVRLVGTLRDITERRRLETEILEISEREQRKFGLDMHDDLGQRLTSLRMMGYGLLQDLKDHAPALVDQAQRLNHHLQETGVAVRQISHRLAPVSLDGEGFRHGLKKLAANTSQIPHVACRFRCARAVTLPDVAAATNLYRIAQEAVNNALKHGRARKIDIVLTRLANGVKLTIQNDGRALPKRKLEAPGMGLQVLRYRAEAIGATLTIVSGKVKGVRVTCTLRGSWGA